MFMTNLWLLANIIFNFSLGAYILFKPYGIASHLSYILPTPASIAEFKSAYGGLPIAIAGYITYLFVSADKRSALIFITVVYCGYGLGRLVGILFNQAHDAISIMYSCIEVSSIVISLLLLRYSRF